MTTTKLIATLAGLLLLAGCTAAAEDTTTKATSPAYGPGWRHEQMVQAWQKGEVPPMMQARGPGFGQGFGPRMMLGEDGKIDTTKLPPWCPLNQTQKPAQ